MKKIVLATLIAFVGLSCNKKEVVTTEENFETDTIVAPETYEPAISFKDSGRFIVPCRRYANVFTCMARIVTWQFSYM